LTDLLIQYPSLLYFLFLLAVFTQTPEFRLMRQNLEPSSFSYSFVDFSIHWLVQIKNSSALLTSEMVMILLFFFISA